MSVGGLNHFNITAPFELLERVRDFYVQALGLVDGARPNFRRRGFWLYAGERPIIHLTASDPAEQRTAAVNHLDHIAFSCSDVSAVVAHLEALGIPYQKTEVPERRQTQIFLRDPAGVGVELNFNV